MSRLAVTIDGRSFEVELTLTPGCEDRCSVVVNGETIPLLIPDLREAAAEMQWMIIAERAYEFSFDDNLRWIRSWSGLHSIEIQDLEAVAVRPRSGDGRVKAPIPGLITRVLVNEGDNVRTGQPLVVLEAMKMENEIRAPFDGLVRAIPVTIGQTVVRSEVLVRVE